MSEFQSSEQTETHRLSTALMVAGMAAGSIAIYKALDREPINPALKEASLLPYCEDIANIVMREHEAVIVGGLPIDAFNDEGSTIDCSSKTITVSSEFDTKLLRGNGTERDYDVMVMDRDENGDFKRLSDEKQMHLKTALTAAAAGRAMRSAQPAPEMSVFSFDEHSSLFHSSTEVEDGELYLRQGYTEQLLPTSAFETWDLVLADGVTVQILAPWEQFWRSMVRFSSGMKPKDAEKLQIMNKKLLSIQPLAEQAKGRLSTAYGEFLDRMLENNSAKNTLNEMRVEFTYTDPDWHRIKRLALLGTARTVMGLGQKSEFVQKVVQGTPKVFNHFVGAK